ncbi:Pyridine nucleotide-disulfide oxidoreductase, FAD/NAD(P)-binding domain protein [Cordyceps fumosorosea ARSEF 2679]|uniref:Pyridine nucleotide-disulfide oxidoreductase, FAD/NAD(P)-binding domain protein n=1 Tax=Cordyceps fumosorosea (strain ARSEF 2679) TaxID=1081104 RepID=A0A167SA04_CORFA|nr:Pyridine nucleotide-disulfide oxidoreductase, FAD/NAD(P)-binding domain protein [Cordyceps fumosorosea ARSEF 2679]OAA59412.1 Pyridine nucleotide-disulfide oxidoreductase, FAD/NAD(P)-binding domain protein [Cordyceps fumosorosea ARSEF 2679]
MAAQEYKLKGLTSISISPGSKQEVEVEGIEGAKVLLINAGGRIQALGSRCTHYGAPLAKGVLTGAGRLTCPWHGACFNARTGDIESAPGLDALPTFKLTERDGAVYVTGDEATIKSSRRRPNFSCNPGATTKFEGDVVIVGGGSGAMGAVEGLREKGYDAGITIISNEGYLPIDRPKLSKALIADAGKLAWREKSWFEAGGVRWVDGEVDAVDFAARAVSIKSGGRFPYTKLILATGGTPRVLPLQGFKVLGNIFTLRSVHDTKRINEAIGEAKGKQIVVVGSSFIGMEVANATSKDNTVTVVGMEKVPLERILGEQVGGAVQKTYEAKGVTFHMSAGVDRADPSGADPSRVGAVLLKDGTRIDADLVILGVGVAPATEYLRDNAVVRLEEDGSLRTDDGFLVQGLKDVYAVGDIATYPYRGPGGDGRPTRVEHWNVAQNAGRAAAQHIVNPAAPAPPFIPVFWSALGAQLRYCGNAAPSVGGWDDVVLHGDLAQGKFIAYYTRGETVVAAASMGMDPAVMQSSELMRLGKMPSKSMLEAGYDVLSVNLSD